MNQLHFSYIYIGTAVIVAVLSVVSSINKQNSANNLLSILLGVVCVWAMFYGLELNSTSLDTIQTFVVLKFIAKVTIPVCWLLFVVVYCGKYDWIKSKYVLLLLIIPALTFVMVATNSLHLLFYTQSMVVKSGQFYYHYFVTGPFYWIHIFYSYSIVLIGLVIVVKTLFSVSKDNRTRVFFIFLSSIIPFVFSFVYVSGFRPDGYIDLTPFGFLIMGILITLGTFNAGLLDIKPLILKSLYDSIPDAILVADLNGGLVSTNPRAQEMMQAGSLDEEHISEIFNSTAYKTSLDSETSYIEVQLSGKIFRVEKSDISTARQRRIGTMYLIVDITLEKEYRDALSKSEEQYRLLIENAQEAILVVQDKMLVFHNPMMCMLTNYSSEELTNMHITKLLHPDDIKIIYNVYDYVASQHNHTPEHKLQFRLVRKDGSVFWIEFSYVIIQWKGAQAGLLFIKDINLQKHNEELKELLIKISNTYINANINDFSDTVHSSMREMCQFVNGDRVYVFNYDWKINTCSNTFEWCAEGISAEIDNLQNIPLDLLPDWVNAHQAGQAMIVSDVLALDANSGARQILEPQGILSLLTIPMMDGGECVGFVGFDFVKTKHQCTEKENDLLIVFSQMLVNLINRKKSNDLLQNQIKIQQLINEISSDLVSVDSQSIDEKIKNILQQTGEFFDVDRSYILRYSNNSNIETNTHEWCKDGVNAQKESIVNVDLSAYPWWKAEVAKMGIIHIANTDILPAEAWAERQEFERQSIKTLLCFPIVSNNTLLGYFGFDSVNSIRNWYKLQIEAIETLSIILGDALIKVDTEIELIKSKELAEAASVAKSNFLSNMSHEIRTPLNGVIGFTELLRTTQLNKLQQDYLENAITSANTLLGVISDVLDFSKIESGKMELESVKTDIVQLFENSSDIIKVMASKKGLELLLNIDPSLPRFAYIDPIRTKQILVNLLSNAVKFTQAGEIELTLNFESFGNGQGSYGVSVRDTGIGIKFEDRNKLFKAFSQADTSTTRRYGGTGLGLIISNSLAKQMGGSIEFESDYGVGTTFNFNIKCKYEYGEMPDYSMIQNMKNVLVIDDNANNRTILEHTLRYWKIDFTGVESGAKAIELLKNNADFDLLIVDYHMPEMDGLETIQSIRNLLKNTKANQPIIMLHSSSDDLSLHQQAQDLDVRFLLTKPVKHDELYYYLNSIYSADDVNQLVDFKRELKETSEPFNLIDKQVTILVAEDTKMNMLLIGNMLRSVIPNLKMYEACNGIEAIQLMKTIQPDIVLMDVQMPELDGLEATRQIRKMMNGRVVPVIALTAGVSKEERELCFKCGMDDFLAKPIEKIELKRILMKYLNKELENVSKATQLEDLEVTELCFDREKLFSKIGNEEVLLSLLQMSKSEYPKYIEEIKVALEKKDIQQLKLMAHKLKGSALNMEFVAMGQVAKHIEENASDFTLCECLLVSLNDVWQELLSKI